MQQKFWQEERERKAEEERPDLEVRDAGGTRCSVGSY